MTVSFLMDWVMKVDWAIKCFSMPLFVVCQKDMDMILFLYLMRMLIDLITMVCSIVLNWKDVKQGEGSYPTLECRDTAFNQKFLDECSDNTNYSGVFQTEKYFANATEELRKDFTFQKEILDPCQNLLVVLVMLYFYMFVEVILI